MTAKSLFLSLSLIAGLSAVGPVHAESLAQTPAKPRKIRIRPSESLVPDSERVIVRKLPGIRPSKGPSDQDPIRVRRRPAKGYGALGQARGASKASAKQRIPK